MIDDHVPRARRGTGTGIYYALTGVTTLAASILVGAGLSWRRTGCVAQT